MCLCLCQTRELERVCLHDSKRSSVEHTRRCAESLMLLGQSDRAVQLLLETDAAHDTYYIDSLRSARARTHLPVTPGYVTTIVMYPSVVCTQTLSQRAVCFDSAGRVLSPAFGRQGRHNPPSN